jgi:dienelactone hydrolase
MADENAFNVFIREQARKLRENDRAPRSREEWDARRKALRDRMLAAMGPFPDKPCELDPRVLGKLDRDGYRIERLIFQSRPDVWVTASAYVPGVKEGQKVPAVLVVHGHWPWARRDPVVQARCLGLVKLGFFVLAVDAFGAGERYTKPARGTYHGALYGATLWPVGHTLLGMQVYDNRRAVDYLLSRKEVNGKLGITGASGGGNQSMYAGALDDRFAAVVPVCSVGNYQAYLRAACCVCEVLPGALKFTEEGDVLGLVAPRALLVMNAARDGIQFSPAEAEKSVGRAKEIFKLHDAEAKVRHVVFDSGHDYNRAMREAMYGWMTLHLKGEGKGEPIAEPEHTLEKPEDLACFPNPDDRPKGFLTPPLFAGKVGRELVAAADKLMPTHPEMWEATANGMRARLKAVLGELPVPKLGNLKMGERLLSENLTTVSSKFEVAVEAGVKIEGEYVGIRHVEKKSPPRVSFCFPDHKPGPGPFQGRDREHLELYLPTVRATRPADLTASGIAGAPDHTLAEHGLWISRPLLAQWTLDGMALLVGVSDQSKDKAIVLGYTFSSLVAILAVTHVPDAVRSVVLLLPPATLMTDVPYASGTYMGILAPGLLKVGDVPHLAALLAPKRLVIAGAVSPEGKRLTQKELEDAFKFTTGVYKAMMAADKLTIAADPDWKKIEL